MRSHRITKPQTKPLKNWQFILILTLLFVIATISAIWHVSSLQSRLIESTSINNAHLLSDVLTEFRSLYTSEVVNTARSQGLEVTHDYATKGNAIPLPATLSLLLGKKLGKQTSGSKIMLYSPYPFPWRMKDRGLNDEFTQQAWQFLGNNPNEPFYRFTELEGQNFLRYATADIMRPACIQCHNNHPDTPKNDWKVGDLRGVLVVDIPLQQVMMETRTKLNGTIVIFSTIALIGIIGIGYVTYKLRHNSAELRKRVKRRTAELADKAEALERTNHELNQFAYVVSHDLKAPLRAIANLSEWIEEDLQEVLTDDTRQQMTLLRSRVARMGSLIQGILQYSRVGRIDDVLEEVDVKELIEEVIAGLAIPKGFTITIDKNMPTIRAARIPLLQVFANLLSNAIKYHDQPEAANVSVSVKTDNPEYTEFCVTDDGPGIAAEYHQKVFEMFQTLNARDKVESTGVGLSIVKKIVESQGGQISLDSTEGKGSSFYFSLPNIKDEQQV